MDLKVFSQEVPVHLYMQKQKRGEQSACVSSAHPEDTFMALASSFIFFFFPLTRIYVLRVTQRKDYYFIWKFLFWVCFAAP